MGVVKVAGLPCLVAVLLAVGCGGAPRRPAATATGRGLTVVLPAGWHQASTSLTPHLVDPREVLAVATYPLRYRPTRCAQVAGSALGSLGASGAFVTLQERASNPAPPAGGFPPRPSHFGPALGGPSEDGACVPGVRLEDHWAAFADAGRRFRVLVAFGPKTSVATRRQAWGILDSLRVDPTVLPDWRPAG